MEAEKERDEVGQRSLGKLGVEDKGKRQGEKNGGGLLSL